MPDNPHDDFMACELPRFECGATAVHRNVLRSRIWTAKPTRVIRDDGSSLQLALWPGIRTLAPTTLIAARTGPCIGGERGLRDLAVGSWELDSWVWQGNALASYYEAGEYFSVHLHRDAAGEPVHWYVNFEQPFQRTPIGIDTFDLFVDLVVTPDLSSYSWKDEDEYAHARRLGLVNQELHQHIGLARERALELLRRRIGPFTGNWPNWTMSPSWELPKLPLGTDSAVGTKAA